MITIGTKLVKDNKIYEGGWKTMNTYQYGTYYCEMAYTTQRYIISHKINNRKETVGYLELDGKEYPDFKPNFAKTLYTVNDLDAIIYFIGEAYKEVSK